MKKEKKTFIEKVKDAGPAAVITSAFIGPGTITTATNAGVNFGYALLWAVVFSGLASFVIMHMSSRLAIGGKKDIIQSSVELFKGSKAWEYFIISLILLVVTLVGFGFESGNIIGGTSGLEDITGLSTSISALIIGILALAAIVFSTPKIVEIIMQTFVALMGLIFVLTAFLVGPDFVQVFKGLIPSIPAGGQVTTIALIGTTIISINLVFHSIASAERGEEGANLEDAYFDTHLNVSMGVLMTLGLVITASAVLFGTNTVVDSPMVFAKALEPTLGHGAKVFAAIGLVLAGLSSAIATPFMVGIIWGKIFNWNKDGDPRPKIVSGIIVAFGTVLAMMGKSPVPIILFAQATSGVFLPIIAGLFLVSANRKELGESKNTLTQNIFGFITLGVMIMLGGKTVIDVIGKIFG